MINQAVKILRSGGLVAIPTETVYGLGADASNSKALAKIFAAKGRPQDHPLIVHLCSVSELSLWARDIPEIAYTLAKAFWPGPLTLILKKAPHVSDLITGGQDTIGLRIPNHPVALKLLQAFKSGIAAPSANRFGRISPTTAEAVREELGDSVDLILEGGQCEVGLESTILDLTSEQPTILRPGKISEKEIEAVIHQALSAKQNHAPRVSGSLESHYAPETKMILMDRMAMLDYLKTLNFPVAVLTQENFHEENIHVVVMPKDVKTYAHELYKTLRELDKLQFQQLIVETVPEDSSWDAVRDRLARAASLPLR